MKIVIISDIHDNLVNLEKCLNWCRKNNVKNIICCGDITNSETLKYLADKFKGTIYLVRGNIELYKKQEVERYKNIDYLNKIGQININNKKISFCHEQYLVNEVLKQSHCDIIFYGHTHKPWIEERDGVKIVNPGTLAGLFQKATFAVWDTKNNKLELKILEKI